MQPWWRDKFLFGAVLVILVVEFLIIGVGGFSILWMLIRRR